VNPLHAAEPLPPITDSPYLPMTKRYISPLYLRIEDVPEYQRLSRTQRQQVAQLAGPLRAAGRTPDLIDRDRVWTAKRTALELIRSAGLDSDRQHEFDRYQAAEGTALADWANWCALAEVHGPDWRRWPSELADPRRAEMKEILNRRIKHREIFRPFAPSIVEESVGEFFEKTHPSPFMTFAYPVRTEKRAVIPAPTHVDGTARLQTVSRSANPLYWKLLRAVGDLTGVPVVLNTSFNDNEPIVCRPEEALECFRRTQMDVLVMGNFILQRKPSAIAREEPGERFAKPTK